MMYRRTVSAFLAIVAAGCAMAVAHAAAPATDKTASYPLSERRVALVIGNAAYPGAPLKNPVNDAAAMATALREEGFEVILRENTSKAELEKAIIDFGQRLTENAVGLAYYSGHGMQVDGRNYLIPVDADIPSEQAVPLAAVDAETILGQMMAARSRVNIVIFDACRNNPFDRRFRAVASTGLAQMSAPTGTLIAYSTAPGKVASDGAGLNGIYTQELLKAIRQPGLPVEEVFKQVRTAVRHASDDEQTPWEESSLEGEFYFRPPLTAGDANGPSLDELRKEAETASLKAQIAEAQAAVAKAAAERLQAERTEADAEKTVADQKLPAKPPAKSSATTVAATVVPGQSVKPVAKPQRAEHRVGKDPAEDKVSTKDDDKVGNKDQVGTLIATINESPFDHLRKAADAGNADAQTRLADMYRAGDGVAEDDDAAIHLYMAAAQQGYGLAEARLATLYANGNLVPRDDAEAVRWFAAAASQGVSAAQARLGFMYRSGTGVARDLEEAFRWLRAAAEQGEVNAESAVGDMYRDGQTVARNEVEAARWYQRAALQGDANAQYNLGTIYLGGVGDLSDQSEGLMWIAAAAGQGHPDAEDVLGGLYLSGRGVLENEAEAAEWFHKAADQGIVSAQNSLGELYRDGRGVPRSVVLAIDWFRRAAAQGSAAARNNLNTMYASESRVAQNRYAQNRTYVPSAQNTATTRGAMGLPAWTFR